MPKNRIIIDRNLTVSFLVGTVFFYYHFPRGGHMYVHYNPNPAGRLVGDCSIRAIAKALNVDWESAYALVTKAGFLMGDMPSSNSVWGAVLRQHGFYRMSLPNCPDCYSASEFCRDNPKGTFVLGFGNHVATVVDGDLYDAWDSSHEIPQYVWYRKD